MSALSIDFVRRTVKLLDGSAEGFAFVRTEHRRRPRLGPSRQQPVERVQQRIVKLSGAEEVYDASEITRATADGRGGEEQDVVGQVVAVQQPRSLRGRIQEPVGFVEARAPAPCARLVEKALEVPSSAAAAEHPRLKRQRVESPSRRCRVPTCSMTPGGQISNGLQVRFAHDLHRARSVA